MPLGIPHSQFLRWAPDDQDKALEWERDKNSRCPSCGTRHEDWEADRFAYVADVRRCPGCEVLDQERENIENIEKEHGKQRGVSVVLVPRQLAREVGNEQRT